MIWTPFTLANQTSDQTRSILNQVVECFSVVDRSCLDTVHLCVWDTDLCVAGHNDIVYISSNYTLSNDQWIKKIIGGVLWAKNLGHAESDTLTWQDAERLIAQYGVGNRSGKPHEIRLLDKRIGRVKQKRRRAMDLMWSASRKCQNFQKQGRKWKASRQLDEVARNQQSVDKCDKKLNSLLNLRDNSLKQWNRILAGKAIDDGKRNETLDLRYVAEMMRVDTSRGVRYETIPAVRGIRHEGQY